MNDIGFYANLPVLVHIDINPGNQNIIRPHDTGILVNLVASSLQYFNMSQELFDDAK